MFKILLDLFYYFFYIEHNFSFSLALTRNVHPSVVCAFSQDPELGGLETSDPRAYHYYCQTKKTIFILECLETDFCLAKSA